LTLLFPSKPTWLMIVVFSTTVTTVVPPRWLTRTSENSPVA
jgi:hypothetical protein